MRDQGGSPVALGRASVSTCFPQHPPQGKKTLENGQSNSLRASLARRAIYCSWHGGTMMTGTVGRRGCPFSFSSHSLICCLHIGTQIPCILKMSWTGEVVPHTGRRASGRKVAAVLRACWEGSALLCAQSIAAPTHRQRGVLELRGLSFPPLQGQGVIMAARKPRSQHWTIMFI